LSPFFRRRVVVHLVCLILNFFGGLIWCTFICCTYCFCDRCGWY